MTSEERAKDGTSPPVPPVPPAKSRPLPLVRGARGSQLEHVTPGESAEHVTPGEPATDAAPAELRDAPDLAGRADAEADPGGDGRRPRVDLTDPKAIRALAHPLRWALLEALAEAGTLTATQASDMLGESPANCAFHLRTLAKYGFVEEAGGGRGRERPWRRTYDTLSWGRVQEDPGATLAAQALDQVWMDRLLTRARRSLTSTATWPHELGDTLGTSSSRLYVTPAEARRLYEEISAAFERLSADREIADRRNPNAAPRAPSRSSSSCSGTPSWIPRRCPPRSPRKCQTPEAQWRSRTTEDTRQATDPAILCPRNSRPSRRPQVLARAVGKTRDIS